MKLSNHLQGGILGLNQPPPSLIGLKDSFNFQQGLGHSAFWALWTVKLREGPLTALVVTSVGQLGQRKCQSWCSQH